MDKNNKGKRKGESLKNFNEVNIEKKEQGRSQRTDIWRGAGTYSEAESKAGKSHTVIVDNQIVYDRDEGGNVYVDTNNGDDPVDLP